MLLANIKKNIKIDIKSFDIYLVFKIMKYKFYINLQLLLIFT